MTPHSHYRHGGHPQEIPPEPVFFVPFGAMTFQDYDEQSFDIVINIYQTSDTETPIADSNWVSSIITDPVSLYIDGSISDKYNAFNYIGGKASFRIDACGIFDYVNKPSWIKANQSTILLDANGEWVTGSKSITPSYDESSYDDLRFMVDNLRIFKARNLQKNEIKIVVVVSFDGGNTWAAQSDPRTVSW